MMRFLQVRDYRKCASERGPGATLIDGFPVVNKVHLRMSLENVVKDIPLISDNSWTYGDLMVSAFNSLSICKCFMYWNPGATYSFHFNHRKWSLEY